ncbi:hypothetical protein LQE85_08870 [Stenotrophomonas rhizophila]|uniref:hypothetical protein n=1 Tax=Stenotrophomonas rhizophila TaxID=216778 RepID=UPI00201D1636|nr:hypothetical protein [Stenotrophomonas rhizophila]UQY89294.1 hypothetical protein LQE85_08870 [Stenotrophomonas rhizophila]
MGDAMSSNAAKIYRQPYEIRQALASLGLTEEIARRIAFAAGAARASTIEVDPAGTPGQLSYIYGVRQVRLELLPLGWRRARFNNVESTVNDELGIQIVFQNVDLACTPKDPEAISGKGAASRDLVSNGTIDMFDNVTALSKSKYGSTPRVWMFCFSSGAEGGSAEISCPQVFEGNQFEGFSERIWVLNGEGGPSPEPREKSGPDDDLGLDLVISRK